jgi:hypothetical protein
MLFFFLLSQLFSIPSQEWIPYYEDKNIAISYTPKLCEDKQNGFAFEYYFIKVENLTEQTLVVNFNKSAEMMSKEEDNVAFVLAPNEIKKGSCEFSPVKLRVYKTDRRSSKSTQIDPFALSKIKVIEVK